MKKIVNFFLALFFVLGLTSCNDTKTPTKTPTGEITNPSGDPATPTENSPTGNTKVEAAVDNIQDGTVLHAWNWSMTTIKSKMAEIKEAGYTAVQTSPMQPQKDYYNGSTWGDQWWKLYQPFGFKIATKENAIGTKDELIDMCKEADKYGIKVIVDVVANHLAGSNTSTFSTKVKDYSPDIVNQNLQHSAGMANDQNVKSMVQGNIGDFPDLQTESTVVQKEVLNLLKEYIDCGVDGFRFDAAKHIETPDDGQYASQFWPYILNGASDYASSKGLDEPYYYGELLFTPGVGRSFSSYTKYMSITDNVTGNNVRNAVINKNSSAASNYAYATGTPANKLMLWAESHDNYANNDEYTSKNVNQAQINKAYAIVASRADASSLYFARPGSTTKMGAMGTTQWKSKEVSEVNKFHNYFIGTSEYLGSSGSFVTNTRYDDTKSGVVIVNLGTTTAVSNLTINKMKDGKYTDHISGNEFTVTNGKISGTMSSTGIAVVYSETASTDLSLSINDNNVIDFYDNFKVKITASNATSAYYTINNGDKVNFTSSTTIDLSNQATGQITIKVTAVKGSEEITKTLTYTKLKATEKRTIQITNIDSAYTSNKTICAWVWKSGTEGKWVTGELNGNTFTFKIEKEYTDFLLASFNKGATPNWDLSPKQTGDAQFTTASIYDGASLTWK